MSAGQQFAVVLAFSIGSEKIAIPAHVQVSAISATNAVDETNAQNIPSYWQLDLLIAADDQFSGEASTSGSIVTSELDVELANNPAALFLVNVLQIPQSRSVSTIFRFLFATSNGYVARSDFLELRLQCCEQVAKVVSFLTPLQAVAACEPKGVKAENLLQTLVQALGCILVRDRNAQLPFESLAHLDAELQRRLAFPWLLPNPSKRKRIAWVQGRENINVSRQAYQAAIALGITLVVLDSPGHWLEDDDGPYASLREAFIPVDLNFDVGFTQRIVDAVKGYPLPIDGIVTISDVRLKLVAEACESLDLPTSPSAAYIIAGDKAKTRLLEPDAQESFVLSSAEDLDKVLESRRNEPPKYPLVVKPCLGWNSDCVSKVTNEAELVQAIQKASQRHADAPDPSISVVVEPYVAGPEVDANLVLLDGEVVFFDVADDFPSRGDAENAGLDDDFQETRVVMPSGLPDQEIDALKSSLRSSILRQGFTSGVFHCEARIRDSAAYYTTENGIFDLQLKPKSSAEGKLVYLHEVNARPPGYLESVAVSQTYGVDYYALRLLLAIGPSEEARIRALSQPFANRNQFHLSIVIIPQTRAGRMKTADAGAAFVLQHPELRDKIPYYDTWMKAGDVLEGPRSNALWWVANLSVISRTSRRDCLRLAQFVEENFDYEVEEDDLP